MLPFLKVKKADGGMITQLRKPDEGKEPLQDPGLEMAMEDMCKAHDARDYKAMAKAFQAAFQILESQPHEEAPHDESI